MSMYKGLNRFRLVVLVAVAALVVGGSWLAFKPDHKNAASTQTTKPAGVSVGQPAGSSTGTASNTLGNSTVALIETADFKYDIPTGWIQMKKDVLDRIGATSGIGSISNLTAIFKTSVSSSTPKDENELKNHALDDIKKNAPYFTLLSSVSTKVDGHSGQKFTYSFTDAEGNNKLRQQLSVIPYKSKTFFLLASSTDADFAKQVSEFDKILASFHFK